MIVDYEKALAAFQSLPARLQASTLSPEYVLADAVRDDSLQPMFWLYQSNQELFIYGFHKSRIPGSDYYDIQSPYGYGGPLATTENDGFISEAWGRYCQWCNSENVIAEFVRFHPMLDNWRFYKGTVIGDRETVYIDLSAEDLFAQYSARVRTAIRKAKKLNLQVEWLSFDCFIKFFPAFYRQEMEAIDADLFYLFDDKYFKKLLAIDNSVFGVCKTGDEIIAAAVFFIGSGFSEYHLSAANSKGKKCGATNLLLHQAGLLAKERGCESFYLGGGTDSEGDNPLLFFKKGYSSLSKAYKIGKKVHDAAAYEELKKERFEMYLSNSSRILFYR